jgi:urease accessory protein
LVPVSFVAVMTLGAAFSRTGVVFPAVEQTIAASVLILGLLVATAVKLPAAAGMALVALFAAFHGYAHGAEMPRAATALNYGLGFITATALIHAAGVGAGSLSASRSPKLARAAGCVIAAGGALLLFR